MNRRTSCAAMMVTVPVVPAAGGSGLSTCARCRGLCRGDCRRGESTASPAATPEEIGPDGWPKSMRACLKASGFEMKSVAGGTIVVTRDEDTQKFLDTRDQCIKKAGHKVWGPKGKMIPGPGEKPLPAPTTGPDAPSAPLTPSPAPS